MLLEIEQISCQFSWTSCLCRPIRRLCRESSQLHPNTRFRKYGFPLRRSTNRRIISLASRYGRGSLSGSLQAHLFYPGDQTSGFHSQELRSSRAFDFPAGLLQHREKVLTQAVPHFGFGEVRQQGRRPLNSRESVSFGTGGAEPSRGYFADSWVDTFKMRPGARVLFAGQTAGSKSCFRRHTIVSTPADRRAETRPAQGQLTPAGYTRYVRRLVRILVLPYFSFFFQVQ